MVPAVDEPAAVVASTPIDVDEAGLDGRFGDRVPVVLRDGVEVLSGRFGRSQVRRALR